MSAFLYTWNPKRWSWQDRADAVNRINNDDQYDTHWSCGNTKKIEIGDQFFLMRLGEEPKGIIGLGYVSSKPYALAHWNSEKATNGESALYTDLLFKALSDSPLITLNELKRRFPDYRWTPQSGGQSVPEDIACELFAELKASSEVDFEILTVEDVQLFAEGKNKAITITTYDRSSKARQVCIAHHGYHCAVCGFNFEAAYGDIGEGYIEVHHLKPIADIGEEYLIDPINDLRPVCANCHRMLHRKRPAISIEELVSCKRQNKARKPGLHRGEIEMNKNFDKPLEDSFWTGEK